MNTLRIVLLLGACAFSAASFTPEGGFPSADDCSNPSDGAIDSISLVRIDSLQPLVDKEVLPVVLGGQGGEMIQYRIALTGSDIPKCVEFRIEFDRCADENCSGTSIEGSSDVQQTLLTYKEGEGRITKTHFQEFSYFIDRGDLARLRVSFGSVGSVGSMTQSLRLWLGREAGFVDAGLPDAGDVDAGLVDAGLADANSADATPLDASSPDAGE